MSLNALKSPHFQLNVQNLRGWGRWLACPQTHLGWLPPSAVVLPVLLSPPSSHFSSFLIGSTGIWCHSFFSCSLSENDTHIQKPSPNLCLLPVQTKQSLVCRGTMPIRESFQRFWCQLFKRNIISQIQQRGLW